jgi:hypothetical protein
MKKWIVVTAAVMFAAGLVGGGAYVALAQGNTLPIPFGGSGPSGWMGRGMMGNYGQAFTGTVPFGRGGMVRGWGSSQPFTGTAPFGPGAMMTPSGVYEQAWTAIAQELGLTFDQLQIELRTKTLAQLAEAKGVKLEKLQEVAQTAHKAALNKLVEEGKLTREQADWMIQRMDATGYPMSGQGRGFGPCHDLDDDDVGSQGFRGERGPDMMGRWG